MKVSGIWGSEGREGVRAQHSLCTAHSMMANPTATSPAMEYSLDPKVSRGSKDPFPSPTALLVPAQPPQPLFSTGVNTGAVGSYIYDKDPEGTVQP